MWSILLINSHLLYIKSNNVFIIPNYILNGALIKLMKEIKYRSHAHEVEPKALKMIAAHSVTIYR